MLAKAPGNRNVYALRVVYLLQGALVWLVSLPVQAAQYVPGRPSALAWAGVGLWAVGLGFEAVGDAQLARFRASAEGRGRIMDRGLWAWTRHPNYFGDFCVWWAISIFAFDNGHWWTVLGPIVMTVLLMRVSGAGLLEKTIGQRRPGYDEYAARTNAFFPGPSRG
jgi:steroid 5-alpha reductase family enzyme